MAHRGRGFWQDGQHERTGFIFESHWFAWLSSRFRPKEDPQYVHRASSWAETNGTMSGSACRIPGLARLWTRRLWKVSVLTIAPWLSACRILIFRNKSDRSTSNIARDCHICQVFHRIHVNTLFLLAHEDLERNPYLFTVPKSSATLGLKRFTPATLRRHDLDAYLI